MPDMPERKVGIIACSGEELAEGTVSRLAALRVLGSLRPHDTVTLCLPLFLAGGPDDRAFARDHPTITVDGCDLRCAARATEMYSEKPVHSLVVTQLVAEHGLRKPEGRRQLNEAGRQAVELTAERLAELVDRALGRRERAAGKPRAAGALPGEREVENEQNGYLQHNGALDGRALGPCHMGNGPEMGFSAPPDAQGCRSLDARGRLCGRRQHLRDADVHLGKRAVQAQAHLLRMPHRGNQADRTRPDGDLHPPSLPPGSAWPRAANPRTSSSQGRRALQAAQKYSLVANSVKSEILIDPEIEVEA